MSESVLPIIEGSGLNEWTMPCRKCDSLEAQLAQLRDMAKENSVQPPSEHVRVFAQKISYIILSLFDRQGTVFLRRRLKCVHFF